MTTEVTLEKIVSLAKRRGFAYPSSEIYGGMANTWDFGPFGTLLKNNIRDLWWKRFVNGRDDMVGIDASIFLSPKVWEASGHLTSFTDALVDCLICKHRTRADHLIEDYLERRGPNEPIPTYNTNRISSDEVYKAVETKKVEGLSLDKLDALIEMFNIPCPNCHADGGNWTPTRRFNLLFETNIGIVEESKSKAYLRGEIAQGIFLNFKNVLDSMRVKVPFGIAQQGKAFRNEITMGQFVHRTLEFDLMEFEYFIHPEGWEEKYEYWKKEMWQFALDIGLQETNLRWREHEEFELSHYSKKTTDIEYKYPFGFKEMWGIAYRDFDLRNHAEHSGKDLSYFDDEKNERFVPHVLEPTFGLSRLVGIALFDSYREEEKDGKSRVYLSLDPKIAPVKAAVFPLLSNKPELVAKAQEVYKMLKENLNGTVEFDDRGNIGKRYLSQDEIGTPFCVTVDFDTIQDNTVTVRHRDTTKQERMPVNDLSRYISNKISY
jgi:glycyl-tRNA synthetase